MGRYIETGSARGKVGFILANIPGAKRHGFNMPAVSEVPAGMVPVCVVDNQSMGFEAAAIAFSTREAAAFNEPSDHRPRTWLLVPRTEILKIYPTLTITDWPE